MKKYCLLCLITFLISVSVVAQRGINKGKIFINNKILEGYISISVYDETPQKFTFSENEKGPFRPISVEEISKVEYDNGITFEKHYINVEIISRDYLERSQEDYHYPENAFSGYSFVQKLLAGSVSLYLFTDKFGYDHFFCKTPIDTAIVYMPNRAYIDKDGAIKKDNSYKNLVLSLLRQNDCSKIHNLDRLEYKMYQMVNMFKVINDCSGSQSFNLNKNNKPKINAGVLLGVVSNYVNPDFSDAHIDREIVPSFGGFFTVAPKYNLKSIAFYLELMLINYKSSQDTINVGPGLKKVEYFKCPKIHISPLIRIYLSENSSKFFFEPGISFSIMKKGILKTDYYDAQGFSSSTSQPYSLSTQFLLTAGAGVDINRLSLQARFSSSLIKDNKSNYFGIIGKISVF